MIGILLLLLVGGALTLRSKRENPALPPGTRYVVVRAVAMESSIDWELLDSNNVRLEGGVVEGVDPNEALRNLRDVISDEYDDVRLINPIDLYGPDGNVVDSFTWEEIIG